MDWPRWCNEQTSHEHSDFVVCVCTAEYRQRIEGKVPPEKGKGVYWEGSLLDDDLYDEKGNRRVIAILFDDVPDTSIPRFLRGWTHCRLRQFALSDPGYEQLIRIITRQAKVEKNRLGPVPMLPPKRAPAGSQEVTFGGPVEEIPPAGKLDRLPGYVRQTTGSDALGDSQSASAGETLPRLTIKDNRLLDPDPPILAQIPYKETPTVDELLDGIRRSLTSPPKVPDPGSYRPSTAPPNDLGRRRKGVKTEIKVAVISGLFLIAATIVTGLFKVPPTSPTPTPSLQSGDPPSFPQEVSQTKADRDTNGKPVLILKCRVEAWPAGYELKIQASDDDKFSQFVANERMNPDNGEVKGPIALIREPRTPTVWYRFVITPLQRPPLFGPVMSLEFPPIKSKKK